jgi:hypothetical protein
MANPIAGRAANSAFEFDTPAAVTVFPYQTAVAASMLINGTTIGRVARAPGTVYNFHIQPNSSIIVFWNNYEDRLRLGGFIVKGVKYGNTSGEHMELQIGNKFQVFTDGSVGQPESGNCCGFQVV